MFVSAQASLTDWLAMITGYLASAAGIASLEATVDPAQLTWADTRHGSIAIGSNSVYTASEDNG